MDVKRELVLHYYKRKFSVSDILKNLKNEKVSRRFVQRCIKRYNETGTVHIKKKPGRTPTVVTENNIKRVRERIRRNPSRSQHKLSASLNISRSSVKRILRNKLRMTAYKKSKCHGLTINQIKQRIKRCRHLINWHDESEIIFSDEKLFILQPTLNSQNDRVYATKISDITPSQRNVQRFQGAASVMVWGAICSRGQLPLLFIDKGVKINHEVYLESVIKGHLVPHAKRIFDEDYYCFQQDSAPAHKAKTVQDWMNINLPDFITATEWPSNSPDLNPLDFSIWGIMQAELKDLPAMNLESFKTYILQIWDNIPDDTMRAACDAFNGRLRQVIKNKGERIEKDLIFYVVIELSINKRNYFNSTVSFFFIQ